MIFCLILSRVSDGKATSGQKGKEHPRLAQHQQAEKAENARHGYKAVAWADKGLEPPHCPTSPTITRPAGLFPRILKTAKDQIFGPIFA